MASTKKVKEEPVRLSPSSLKAWYDAGCPRRWHYDRDWRVKEKNEFMETGSETHRVMAGELTLENTVWKNTPLFHDKIKNVLSYLDVTFVGKPEWEQQFEILPGVIWTRIMDQMARTGDGKMVVIDYKTTGAGWKTLGDSMILPQSLATQSIGYLYPPGPHMAKEWPTDLWYIVVGFRGPGGVVPYKYTKTDEDNFFGLLRGAVAAIREARASDWPRNYGRNCFDCPFNAMCYGLEGHEDLYEAKPPRKGVNGK